MTNLSKVFESDLKPRRIIEELSLYLGHPIDIHRDLIIFDEIQACPQALTSLKYFQEDLPELHICGAGSLLGVHLNPGSFPVGKVKIETLNPMSFEEFLIAVGDNKSVETLRKQTIPSITHDHLWEQLKRFFVVGGMPEAVATYCENKEDLLTAFSLVREKQDHLVTAYYADMAKHSGKVNAMHIDRVFKAVPAQLERQQDGSEKKFKFRGVVPGVTHYTRLASAIDWLIAAGLVIKVHIVNSGKLPFKAYSKENTFKLFLFDIGILGSMSGLPPKTIMSYKYGSYKGYFAENYVAQAFLCSGEKELFAWSEKTAEIEFLREIDGQVIPIEVKSGRTTKAKSLKVFTEKYHPNYQVILSGNPLSIDEKRKIHFYPLYLAGFFPFITHRE